MFADEIAAGQLARVPLLSSFSAVALEAARDATPDLPRALLMSTLTAGWQRPAGALGLCAVHINHKNLTHECAAEIKRAGFGLFCYTVNDPARARELFGWGVDAFCTDRIDLIGPEFA
jgi:glycerophosphoryl diester phosphodiesterase